MMASVAWAPAPHFVQSWCVRHAWYLECVSSEPMLKPSQCLLTPHSLLPKPSNSHQTIKHSDSSFGWCQLCWFAGLCWQVPVAPLSVLSEVGSLQGCDPSQLRACGQAAGSGVQTVVIDSPVEGDGKGEQMDTTLEKLLRTPPCCGQFVPGANARVRCLKDASEMAGLWPVKNCS